MCTDDEMRAAITALFEDKLFKMYSADREIEPERPIDVEATTPLPEPREEQHASKRTRMN